MLQILHGGNKTILKQYLGCQHGTVLRDNIVHREVWEWKHWTYSALSTCRETRRLNSSEHRFKGGVGLAAMSCIHLQLTPSIIIHSGPDLIKSLSICLHHLCGCLRSASGRGSRHQYGSEGPSRWRTDDHWGHNRGCSSSVSLTPSLAFTKSFIIMNMKYIYIPCPSITWHQGN